ncbi:MAG TPA: hypothetical protein VGM83_12935 [Devosiaceae bacterium]|jgi:hypothetical protein
MQRMCRRPVAIALLAMLFVIPMQCGAYAAQAKVGGIYSDLHYNEDGGDLLGTELFIVATEDGWAVFYQHWEGGGDKPIVVPATVQDGRLSFDIPDSYSGGGEYEGVVTAAGFEGTIHYRDSDGAAHDQPIKLKRTKSYWE